MGETCAASEPLSATRPTAPPTPAFGVLVFTRNTGYTHQSIPAAVAAVHVLGASHGFAVEATEDPNVFADSALSRFRSVVFLNTTGDVLDDRQQAAFERYIAAGGGFVGVHSASDTEADWPWYQGLVGARVAGHPAIQPATINVSGVTHPSTTALPRPWRRTDEWYNYVALPRDVTVLASVDETSYSGGSHGVAHPVTWTHTYRGGRAWYTAMGHTTCSYAERPFLDHLLGGILWAAGIDTGPAPA
ncbi:MAG: ThuA domain-containing protein [Gemmatimonadales bacterium]